MKQDRGDLIPVRDLLDLVKRAYDDAHKEIKDKGRLPELKSATLTLTTTIGKGGSAGFELLALSASGKKTVGSSQKISIKLEKPEMPKAPGQPGFAAARPDVYREVVNGIVASSAAAEAAYDSRIADATFDSVTTAIGFDVKKEGEVGLKFALTLLGWGLKGEAGASRESSAAHEIELVFQRPS